MHLYSIRGGYVSVITEYRCKNNPNHTVEVRGESPPERDREKEPQPTC